MRRSTITMSAVLALLSTPLAAQRAVNLGVTWTLGSGWQLQALDVGLLGHAGLGPIRHVGATLRLGEFVDQGAIFNGAKGFIAALALSARTGTLDLAEVGNESNPSQIGADVTIEGTGWLGANSPLPQGGHWASLALLPGLRFGSSTGGAQYAVVLGPTWFLGQTTDVHALLGVRAELPLAR